MFWIIIPISLIFFIEFSNISKQMDNVSLNIGIAIHKTDAIEQHLEEIDNDLSDMKDKLGI